MSLWRGEKRESLRQSAEQPVLTFSDSPLRSRADSRGSWPMLEAPGVRLLQGEQ